MLPFEPQHFAKTSSRDSDGSVFDSMLTRSSCGTAAVSGFASVTSAVAGGCGAGWTFRCRCGRANAGKLDFSEGLDETPDALAPVLPLAAQRLRSGQCEALLPTLMSRLHREQRTPCETLPEPARPGLIL